MENAPENPLGPGHEELARLRGEIDQTDDQLARLFAKRLDLAAAEATCRHGLGLPEIDATQERETVNHAADVAGPAHALDAKRLTAEVLALSRAARPGRAAHSSPVGAAIAAGIANGTVFPKDPGFVACQGVEGSFGQQAADHLFCQPRILFFQRFADVMQAVEKGMCAYGVLPIENSIAGSVTEVYDQIRQHSFYIVRGVKLRVDHCLLARPGVRLEQIKEVVSHEQALRQCSHALEAMKGVSRTAVANTAIAAQQVAASDRDDVAAIASFACTRLYGLQVLQSNIANVAGNYTRFICISRRPEIYPGANRICLMLALPHAPGALYRLLAGFAALGLNLRKIESRPIPGRDFEFMFYLTIEGSVRDPEARDLICSLESTLEVCGFLGNYGEED